MRFEPFFKMLPVLRPEWFPPFPLFRIWLQAIASEAEGLVCISRSVAQQFLAALARDWDGPLTALKNHLDRTAPTADPPERA